MHYIIAHVGGLILEINLLNPIPSSWLWVLGAIMSMHSTLTLVNMLLDFPNYLRLSKKAFLNTTNFYYILGLTSRWIKHNWSSMIGLLAKEIGTQDRNEHATNHCESNKCCFDSSWAWCETGLISLGGVKCIVLHPFLCNFRCSKSLLTIGCDRRRLV